MSEPIQRSTVRRFAHGTAWSLGGNVVLRACNVFTAIVIARALGKEEFGAFGIFQSTVGLLQVFVSYGMGLTATKFIAEHRTSEPARAGHVLAISRFCAAVLSIIVGLATYLLAGFIGSGLLGHAELKSLLQIGSIALAFGAYNGAQLGALTGLERFSAVARINAISGLAFLGLTIVGAKLWGVWGAVAGNSASSCLACLVTVPVLRREIRTSRIPVSLEGPAENWRELYRFSLPAMIASSLASPVTWICAAMLLRVGGGFGEVAIINAANQWRNLLLFLPAVMTQVSLPLLASSRISMNQEPRSGFVRTLLLTQAATDIIAMALGSALMLAATVALSVYGKTFSSGAPVLIIIVLASLYQCFVSSVQPALEATGRMWLGARLNIVWAAANLAFCALTVSRLGAMGVALANAISYLILSLCSIDALKNTTPPGFRTNVLVNGACATTLAVVCLFLHGTLRLCVAIPLAVSNILLVLWRNSARFDSGMAWLKRALAAS